MGIQVEFNPDLALRDVGESRNGSRKIEECIPEPLETGKVYSFLKRGQRNYWLHGEIPLLQTKGEGNLSLPIASIVILNAKHELFDDEIWTSGQYRIIEVFGEDKVRFNGFAKL